MPAQQLISQYQGNVRVPLFDLPYTIPTSAGFTAMQFGPNNLRPSQAVLKSNVAFNQPPIPPWVYAVSLNLSGYTLLETGGAPPANGYDTTSIIWDDFLYWYCAGGAPFNWGAAPMLTAIPGTYAFQAYFIGAGLNAGGPFNFAPAGRYSVIDGPQPKPKNRMANYSYQPGTDPYQHWQLYDGFKASTLGTSLTANPYNYNDMFSGIACQAYASDGVSNYAYFGRSVARPRGLMAVSQFDVAACSYYDVTLDNPVLDALFAASGDIQNCSKGFTCVVSVDGYSHDPNIHWTVLFFNYDMSKYWTVEFEPRTGACALALRSSVLGGIPWQVKIDIDGSFYFTTGNVAAYPTLGFTSRVLDIPWFPWQVQPNPATFALPCFNPCSYTGA